MSPPVPVPRSSLTPPESQETLGHAAAGTISTPFRAGTQYPRASCHRLSPDSRTGGSRIDMPGKKTVTPLELVRPSTGSRRWPASRSSTRRDTLLASGRVIVVIDEQGRRPRVCAASSQSRARFVAVAGRNLHGVAQASDRLPRRDRREGRRVVVDGHDPEGVRLLRQRSATPCASPRCVASRSGRPWWRAACRRARAITESATTTAQTSGGSRPRGSGPGRRDPSTLKLAARRGCTRRRPSRRRPERDMFSNRVRRTRTMLTRRRQGSQAVEDALGEPPELGARHGRGLEPSRIAVAPPLSAIVATAPPRTAEKAPPPSVGSSSTCTPA